MYIIDKIKTWFTNNFHTIFVSVNIIGLTLLVSRMTFNTGYLKGHNEGYSIGYEKGHFVGYNEGHFMGYTEKRDELDPYYNTM